MERDSNVATKSETGMNARAANFFTHNLRDIVPNHRITLCTCYGPSTKDVRQMGRGGGFEIPDIPGRGEGGGLWKFGRPKISEKIKISQSSLKLQLEIMIDRNSNMRAFTYMTPAPLAAT